MSIDVPDQPQFGDPLPATPSPEVLAFFARRRSASALTLRAPGPAADEITTLLRLAARVPDHGKLAPWRFIVLEGAAKDAVAGRLQAIAAARPDAAKAEAALGKFKAPPVAVAVVSSPKPGEIPEWEQLMSAGAVCLTLLNTATAMGYGANWITDWYAYDPEARAILGLSKAEKVAGFVLLGTPREPPKERERPAVAPLVSRWKA